MKGSYGTYEEGKVQIWYWWRNVKKKKHLVELGVMNRNL